MAKSGSGKAYNPSNFQEPIVRPQVSDAHLDGTIMGTGSFNYATGRCDGTLGSHAASAGKSMLKHVYNPKTQGS